MQAGLWEMAWSALQMTLSLNMSKEIPYEIVPEKVVLDLENKVLEVNITNRNSSPKLNFHRYLYTSDGRDLLDVMSYLNLGSVILPYLLIFIISSYEYCLFQKSDGVLIWQLWAKLEAIRQGHHFLPVKSSTNFPQRVVAPSEISNLIYHVRRTSHFRLLLLLPLLANVPFLPRRHCVLTELLPQLQHWAIDSVETHLATAFPCSVCIIILSC